MASYIDIPNSYNLVYILFIHIKSVSHALYTSRGRSTLFFRVATCIIMPLLYRHERSSNTFGPLNHNYSTAPMLIISLTPTTTGPVIAGSKWRLITLGVVGLTTYMGEWVNNRRWATISHLAAALIETQPCQNSTCPSTGWHHHGELWNCHDPMSFAIWNSQWQVWPHALSWHIVAAQIATLPMLWLLCGLSCLEAAYRKWTSYAFSSLHQNAHSPDSH